jgi:5-carboxymethyl-2-hydroxymuconate isomerase
MPHITLEYSANLGARVPLQALAAELHPMLVRVANASLQACKSRAYRADDFCIADGGAQHALAHLTIALMPGRAPEVLTEVGHQALALLKRYIRAPEGVALQYSVEIVDLRRETYFRAP